MSKKILFLTLFLMAGGAASPGMGEPQPIERVRTAYYRTPWGEYLCSDTCEPGIIYCEHKEI